MSPQHFRNAAGDSQSRPYKALRRADDLTVRVYDINSGMLPRTGVLLLTGFAQLMALAIT